jgi:hypothetical protein
VKDAKNVKEFRAKALKKIMKIAVFLKILRKNLELEKKVA